MPIREHSPAVSSEGREIHSALVDAHVHIHRCFDLTTFLEAAVANFTAASLATGGKPFHGLLLLTEAAGEDRFTELAALTRADHSGAWTFGATDEGCSLTAARGPSALALVAGRQVATADGLEVLVFGTRERFEDGRPLSEVLERMRRLGLVHAIPWGAGKWLFRRGRLLTRILESSPGSGFCLGDEGGRPVFWPRVGHFEEARGRGIRVLRGTDPLPFPGEVSRAGSFGFRIEAPIDPARPMASLRAALEDPAVELRDYGLLERPVAFFIHQWGMQRRKRAARARSGAEIAHGGEPSAASAPPASRRSGAAPAPSRR